MFLKSDSIVRVGDITPTAIYAGDTLVWGGSSFSIADTPGFIWGAEATDLSTGTLASWPMVASGGTGTLTGSGMSVEDHADGFKSVRFTGSGRVNFPTSMPTGAGQRTVMIVMRPQVGISRNAFGYGTEGAGQIHDLIANFGGGRIDIDHYYGGGYDTIGSGVNTPTDHHYLLTIRYTGTNIIHRLNGSDTFTRGFSLNTGAHSVFRVGGGVYAPYDYFVGCIAAIYGFSIALTGSDLDSVEEDLMNRYLIS